MDMVSVMGVYIYGDGYGSGTAGAETGGASVTGIDGVDNGTAAGVGIAGKLLDGAVGEDGDGALGGCCCCCGGCFFAAVRFFVDDGMLRESSELKIAFANARDAMRKLEVGSR